MSTKQQHLVIIIDNNKVITPKKYTYEFNEGTKEELVPKAKKLYEKNHKNFQYEAYYFLHEIIT